MTVRLKTQVKRPVEKKTFFLKNKIKLKTTLRMDQPVGKSRPPIERNQLQLVNPRLHLLIPPRENRPPPESRTAPNPHAE